MMDFIYNRFEGRIDEKKLRKLLKKGVKSGYLKEVSTNIIVFKQSNFYKNLKYDKKGLIDLRGLWDNVTLYKKQDQLYVLGVSPSGIECSLFDELKIYSYNYYDEFCFIFIAAHSIEEAIFLIQDYLKTKQIDENCLNLIDGIKIESIPEVFKIIEL